MAEPLFGSVSPIWHTTPVPAFGYFQAPMPPPNGPTTFPAFAGPEIGFGLPAPALLATVALRRGQPLGPTNDQEIEEFIYDSLDLFSGASDVDVRCEGGRAILTGVVQNKRLKRDLGEVAWAIPGVNDVHNNLTIAARRRSRASREREGEPPAVAARKQA